MLDTKTTLRVRVIAPLDVRVARIAERDRLSEADARAKVLRIDGERVAFNRHHYNADLTDPNNYDMVLNTGTLGIEGAAAQTVSAFQLRFGAI